MPMPMFMKDKNEKIYIEPIYKNKLDDFTKSLDGVVETVKKEESCQEIKCFYNHIREIAEEWKPNIKETKISKISATAANVLTAKLFQYDLDVLMEMKFDLMWNLKMTQEEIDNLSFAEFYKLYKDLEEEKDKLRKTIK